MSWVRACVLFQALAHGWVGNRAGSRPKCLLSKFAAPASEFQTTLSLGAPKYRPCSNEYTTKGGVTVNVAVNTIQEAACTIERLVDALDIRLGETFLRALPTGPPSALLTAHCLVTSGGLFMSSYEFPGRYARWTLGFVNPPLLVTGRGRKFTVTALNERGLVLLAAVASALAHHEHVESFEHVEHPRASATATGEVTGIVKVAEASFPEENRSKQPSLFSVVRCVVDLFHHDADPQLGLYGGFGYDLAFQFEPIILKHERPKEQRDLVLVRLPSLSCGLLAHVTRFCDLQVLYLPDQIIVVDNMKHDAWELRYDFTFGGATTNWQARDGPAAPFRLLDSEAAARVVRRDTLPGAFSAKVAVAREEFKVSILVKFWHHLAGPFLPFSHRCLKAYLRVCVFFFSCLAFRWEIFSRLF
jgi:anthranilate synthase